jgi:hypothetical protein
VSKIRGLFCQWVKGKSGRFDFNARKHIKVPLKPVKLGSVCETFIHCSLPFLALSTSNIRMLACRAYRVLSWRNQVTAEVRQVGLLLQS